MWKNEKRQRSSLKTRSSLKKVNEKFDDFFLIPKKCAKISPKNLQKGTFLQGKNRLFEIVKVVSEVNGKSDLGWLDW